VGSPVFVERLNRAFALAVLAVYGYGRIDTRRFGCRPVCRLQAAKQKVRRRAASVMVSPEMGGAPLGKKTQTVRFYDRKESKEAFFQCPRQYLSGQSPM
jgi:hypothetical protein